MFVLLAWKHSPLLMTHGLPLLQVGGWFCPATLMAEAEGKTQSSQVLKGSGWSWGMEDEPRVKAYEYEKPELITPHPAKQPLKCALIEEETVIVQPWRFRESMRQ